jgi:predicted dithiol-disulfide oxidoreductase (DUF899 family)
VVAIAAARQLERVAEHERRDVLAQLVAVAGTEQVGGTHYYLDMTALGRQEDREEPKGRSTGAPRADQVGAGRT